MIFFWCWCNGATSVDLVTVTKLSKHGRTEDQGAFLFHVPSSVVLVRPGCRDYAIVDVDDSKEVASQGLNDAMI
jgi:hypothetical protein